MRPDSRPGKRPGPTLGFHSIHYSPVFGGSRPVDEVLEATARAGFQSIGLDLSSIESFIAAGGSVQRLSQAIASNGLQVSDLVALVIRPGVDVRRLAVRLGELAGALGAPLCVTAVAEPMHRADVVSVLDTCAVPLSTAGVRLALEYGSYMGLTSLEQAVAICDELGWERAGVLLDSYQALRSGTTFAEIEVLVSSEIALVQFADAVGPPPSDCVHESRHHRHIPGMGELPLGRFVDAVLSTGYGGAIVAEVLSDDVRDGDPHTTARAIHGAMSRFWSA